MAGKAPRRPWYRQQPWYSGICKLQILKDAQGFKSDSQLVRKTGSHHAALMRQGRNRSASKRVPRARRRSRGRRVPGPSCAWIFLASTLTAGPRSSSRTRSCRIFQINRCNRCVMAPIARAWPRRGTTRRYSALAQRRCPYCSRPSSASSRARRDRRSVTVASCSCSCRC